MVSIFCSGNIFASTTENPNIETPVVSNYSDLPTNYLINVDKYEDVKAHTTDVYTKVFAADERVVVSVFGDGDTDLDLYIYDENGNLIDSDTDGTDTCICSFTPKWKGSFKIKVKNLGDVYNHYHIIMIQ